MVQLATLLRSDIKLDSKHMFGYKERKEGKESKGFVKKGNGRVNKGGIVTLFDIPMYGKGTKGHPSSSYLLKGWKGMFNYKIIIMSFNNGG